MPDLGLYLVLAEQAGARTASGRHHPGSGSVARHRASRASSTSERERIMTEQTTDSGKAPLVGFKDTTGLGERVTKFAQDYGIIRGGQPNQSEALRLLLEFALRCHADLGSVPLISTAMHRPPEPEPEPPNGPEDVIPADEVDFTASLPVALAQVSDGSEDYHVHAASCPETLAALRDAPGNVISYDDPMFSTLADIAEFEYLAIPGARPVESMRIEVQLHVCTRAPKLVKS
jgi:hypothetical protein